MAFPKPTSNMYYKIEENICSKNNENLKFDKFNIIYENL